MLYANVMLEICTHVWIGTAPCPSTSTSTHKNQHQQQQLFAKKKHSGDKGEQYKIGIEPKGERKAAIDREITAPIHRRPGNHRTNPPTTES
jgi:hypothetical protein